MAKGGPERAVQYLTTAGSGIALAEKIAAEHANGDMALDAYSLASLYRKEISVPTSAKDRYQNLASLLATWIGADFEAKLKQLSTTGQLSGLMLTTQRQAFSRSNYRLVSVAEMREKLPAVVEKVRKGDLTRFVHLISAAHCYGVCVTCGTHPVFSALMPRQHIPPMKISFAVDPSSLPHATKLLESLEFPSAFYPVLGLCHGPNCRVTCSNCRAHVAPKYDPEWVTALREDGMCKVCAAKQLINVKRPNFTRLEQRALRRLIIQ